MAKIVKSQLRKLTLNQLLTMQGLALDDNCFSIADAIEEVIKEKRAILEKLESSANKGAKEAKALKAQI